MIALFQMEMFYIDNCTSNESCGEVSIELKVTDDTFDVFGVCTGENNDFAGLLQNAAEKIKEDRTACCPIFLDKLVYLE